MDRHKVGLDLFPVVGRDVRKPEGRGFDPQRLDAVPIGRVPGQPRLVPADVQPSVSRQDLSDSHEL